LSSPRTLKSSPFIGTKKPQPHGVNRWVRAREVFRPLGFSGQD
jgi:hypothetical protein